MRILGLMGRGKRTCYFCALLVAHAVGPVEAVVELDEELFYIVREVEGGLEWDVRCFARRACRG